MASTTIRLKGDTLKKIEAIRPEGKSTSAFVRQLVEDACRENQLRHAAYAYCEFLSLNPAEKAAMDEWESAGALGTVPENA